MLGYVAYRLPNSEKTYTLQGKVITYDKLNEVEHTDSFVFNSFNSKINFALIDLINCDLKNFKLFKSTDTKYCYSESEYLKTCRNLIKTIQTKDLNKVVLSKIKKIESNFNPSELFLELNSAYKNTFNYIISIPNMGCWIGSTPEILLSIADTKYKTVSIAGTKTDENIKWGKKEIEEQQIVSDFINDALQSTGTFTQSETKTIKAGNVFHLKTEFEGVIKQNWTDLVSILHPTPATCGLPKETAKNHIKSIEKHNRKYYTGFLGPISKLKSNLFVNLRCLEVQENNSFLYLGGGITAHSNAEDEWRETEKKADTLLKIIEQISK